RIPVRFRRRPGIGWFTLRGGIRRPATRGAQRLLWCADFGDPAPSRTCQTVDGALRHRRDNCDGRRSSYAPGPTLCVLGEWTDLVHTVAAGQLDRGADWPSNRSVCSWT